MEDREHTTPPPSKLSAFFFHNKISVAILVVVMVLATLAIPGSGALIPMILTLVALLGCLRAGSARMIGLSRPESWGRTLLVGAGLGIGLQVAFHLVVDPAFEMLTGSKLDVSALDPVKGNVMMYVIWLAIGWIVGGLLEELSFRGYLISRIRYLLGAGALGTTIAVLASAVPFGIAHMYQGWAGVLSATTMGLCFALIYVKSGSRLWIAILAHGFANTTDITLIYLEVYGAFRLI